MRLDGACFARGKRIILRDVTLHIAPGEHVGLVGGNGAGKTTLVRLLAGLERPSAGAVVACARGAGYVPQAYAESLFPWRSAAENVAMPRLVAPRSSPARKRPSDSSAAPSVPPTGALDVARTLCASLLPGVDPSRRAGRLSGGEQQALALGRALASPGDVVLADEPFTALSPATRERAHAVLREWLGERTLVLVSHDTDDVALFCDRVLCVRDGRVDEAGA